jgi:Uma2 family endonuclease
MVISPLTLNLDTVHLTDEQFYQLCQNNRELQFELTAKGELIIMSPVGGETANREAELIADLGIWNRQTDLGFTFSCTL